MQEWELQGAFPHGFGDAGRHINEGKGQNPQATQVGRDGCRGLSEADAPFHDRRPGVARYR